MAARRSAALRSHEVTSRRDSKLRAHCAAAHLTRRIARLRGRLLPHGPATGAQFRLIGIGVSDYAPADAADPPDFADPDLSRRRAVERTIDAVRDRFGREAIGKGRGLDDG